jgi:PP-loop superfamily ATP-utilizing enzyme
MVYGMTDDEIVEAMQNMASTIDDLEARFELATRFQIAEDIAIEKRGGLENKVVIRTFAMDSIVALRANGQEWK